MNWQELPMVRILAPFAGGILLGEYWPAERVAGYLPFALIAGMILLCRWHQRGLAFRRRNLFGLGLSLLLAGSGYLSVVRQPHLHQPDHFSRSWTPGHGLLATVRSGAPDTSGSWKQVLVDVIAVEREPGKWRPAGGRLLTYHRENRSQPGDTLLLRCRIDRIAPPRNPAAFDYARYMGNRGVFHQAFIRAEQVIRLPYRGLPGIRQRAAQLRRRCLQVLYRHLKERETFAVGAALVLGYREALGEDLREAYARSGAMHILAVSGLHVGLVYLALSFGMRLLPFRSGGWRLLRLLVQLLGIWGFVFVAGLPPSAVRAATMFSFFAAGRAWSRDASVYNILAAAAFCMLVVNPRLLFDVGFQLSFAAVTGIVSWQGDIYRSLYLAHPVPDYLWKLISVSVAAQLATFPLSLYYFQQFPLLFWLSGLIAVPAAGLILGGGLSLLLLGSVPWLGKTVGWLLNELISLVNASIAWISGLPGSRLSGLWIDGWVVGLWYALIFALVLAFYRRRGKYWLPVLGLLLLLLVYRAVRRWSAVVQRQVVIYAVPGHSLIDLFDGAGAITLADSLLDEQQEAYAAEKFRLYRSIKRRETYHIGDRLQNRSCWYEHGLLQFHHFRLLILGPDTPLSHLPDLRVDAVLIRGDPPWNPERVLSVIRCRKVILDASCSYPTLQRWRRYCARRHLSFQDLRRDGAFVLDLNQHSTIYL